MKSQVATSITVKTNKTLNKHSTQQFSKFMGAQHTQKYNKQSISPKIRRSEYRRLSEQDMDQHTTEDNYRKTAVEHRTENGIIK